VGFFDDNNQIIRRLVQKFTGYPINIDAETLREWIRQFEEEDWPLALKLLDWIDYYDNARVCRELQDFYRQIQTRGSDINNSYFVPFCYAGHSGEIILERFRYANNLKAQRFDGRCVHVSGLNLFYKIKGSSFYFLEDFIGTGNQSIEMWNKVSEFVPPDNNLILFVINGHEEGIERVQNETPLEVICNRLIYDNQKVFSDGNETFSELEKRKIRQYCERVKTWPEGYGGCQSNVVFYYRAPNNTISIIRSSSPNWDGLFIRNL